jgi:isopentenyldiphosphate isomerase
VSRSYKDTVIKKMAKELGISTKQAIKGYKKIKRLGLLPDQMREAIEAERAEILCATKQEEGGND